MHKLMSKDEEQKYIDKFKQDKDFYSVIQDIAENEIVLKMRDFCQHGDTSTYLHCLNVSYALYNICKKKNLDYVSAARAAMLHDFYLYDWHLSEGRPYEKGWHAFKHPIVALQNAEKYFELNDLQRDIILHHMWPFFFSRPKTKEGFWITVCDKKCAKAEMKEYSKKQKNNR